MKLGIIGTGRWGNAYAKTMRGMGVDFWQETRNWHDLYADGVIVATPPETHANIAMRLLGNCTPMIIEKPIAMNAADAKELLRAADAAIVFTGHTRLYSSRWRAFKKHMLSVGVESVRAEFGGPSPIDPMWDYGSHLVAMCLDLGFDPLKATIYTGGTCDLVFRVNETWVYWDEPETPTPLEVLITEFMQAIDKYEPDIRGLELGVKVVEALESMEACVGA